MDIAWVLGAYALTASLVGFFVYFGGQEDAHMLKKKQVGPSYWGAYNGSAPTDQPSEQTIQLPKPCKDDEATVGSGMYARGRAVKSARG